MIRAFGAHCQTVTHVLQQRWAQEYLFDHLVGEREQSGRNVKTDSLGGPEIEDELELS